MTNLEAKNSSILHHIRSLPSLEEIIAKSQKYQNQAFLVRRFNEAWLVWYDDDDNCHCLGCLDNMSRMAVTN